VAQVALVDEWGRPVCNLFIKVDVPVVSYLTALTGITKELMDQYGQPLADTLVTLRAHLPPNAILVGQNIKKDVEWLQLVEGLDFASMIDLAALFRLG
jgi:RNA exonuclease 4